MERLKDNPEAREQIERALAEYRKAMEQGDEAGRGRSDGGPPRPATSSAAGRPGRPEPAGVRRAGSFGSGGDRRPGGGRLGVAVAPVGEALAEQLDLPAGRGVVVTNVVPGSTAEKAGVRKNDVILTFSGQDVDPGRFARGGRRGQGRREDRGGRPPQGQEADPQGDRTARGPEARAPAGADLDFKAPKVELRFPEKAPKVELRFPQDGRLKGPAPGKSGFEKMQVQVNDDEFTIDATKGDTRYRLTGSVEGGKATPVADRSIGRGPEGRVQVAGGRAQGAPGRGPAAARQRRRRPRALFKRMKRLIGAATGRERLRHARSLPVAAPTACIDSAAPYRSRLQQLLDRGQQSRGQFLARQSLVPPARDARGTPTVPRLQRVRHHQVGRDWPATARRRPAVVVADARPPA